MLEGGEEETDQKSAWCKAGPNVSLMQLKSLGESLTAPSPPRHTQQVRLPAAPFKGDRHNEIENSSPPRVKKASFLRHFTEAQTLIKKRQQGSSK